MKKNFFSIFAFAALMSISVCTTSCNNDDDENAPQQQAQQKSSQEAATKIAQSLLEYEAACESGYKDIDKEEVDKTLASAKTQIQLAVNSGNTEYLNQVQRFVADATGLSETTIDALFSDTNVGYSGLSTIMNGLSTEEKQSVKTNATQYLEGYEDGKKLAAAYETLSTSDDELEKKEALDILETNIKERYQKSGDAIYKSTYVKAASIATGLKADLVKMIMDSDHPKETALIAFGINLEGGQTASQAATDAVAAAKLLESVKGKTAFEILNDNELLQQVGTYKEAYRNGTDEYRETFKNELQANGVSTALIDMFDSEKDFDLGTIMALLGITF